MVKFSYHLLNNFNAIALGFWSRRIDDSHRIVYAVTDSHITLIACRYHYQKD
ncbi:MAG: type II toxin-antitoxin system YoeB family toxin [Mariprofundaceae bacterium]